MSGHAPALKPLPPASGKAYDSFVSNEAGAFAMEHQSHISDKSDLSPVARIIAAIAVLAIVCGSGVYLVYGSGLWNPQVQHNSP
jgi:hypothetical protein